MKKPVSKAPIKTVQQKSQIVESKPVNPRLLFFLATLPALIPIILYYSVLSENALNIPYLDDWDAVLKFLSNFSTANFSNKLALLFSQHNEHRILSSRLLYVFYKGIFGTINFKNLIYIGNAQLIVILAVLTYFLRKQVVPYFGIPILILSFCLFDLSNYENADWAMASAQNYGVIMFFFLSLFFYSLNKSWAIYIAVLFQFICAFSSGNGVMAGLAIILFTLLNKDKNKIIVSVVSFVIFSSLYFFHYHSVPNQNIGKSAASMLEYFLGLSGAHFGRDYRTAIAVILYLAFPCLFIVNKRFAIKKDMIPFIPILFFVVASITTTSILRSGGKVSIEQGSYTIRYLIYPHLLAGLLFCLLSIRVASSKFKLVFVLVASIFFIKGYKENYAYGDSGFTRINTRLTTTRYNYPDTIEAKKIDASACKEGIYCIGDNR